MLSAFVDSYPDSDDQVSSWNIIYHLTSSDFLMYDSRHVHEEQKELSQYWYPDTMSLNMFFFSFR